MDLIAWGQICKPIKDGGLGIGSIRSMNRALLVKQGQRTYHGDKEWSTIWKHKYLFNAISLSNFISSPDVLSPSAIWGVVQGTKNTLVKGCSQKIGNGKKVRFWEYSWLMYHPLIEDFEDTTQVDRCKQMYGTLVGHYWHNNTWVNLIDVDQVFYNIQISLNDFLCIPTMRMR